MAVYRYPLTSNNIFSNSKSFIFKNYILFTVLMKLKQLNYNYTPLRVDYSFYPFPSLLGLQW